MTIGSGIKANWKCSLGHEWIARICDRVNGNSCPYCTGKKVLIGYNDLSTTNEELLKEWDYEKNEGLIPKNYKPKSNIKIWWKCELGHS